MAIKQPLSVFDITITREHVTAHKPNPEAYEQALSQLSLSNHEVLIYEDSYAGLQAAHAAGCKSIAVQHEFNIENDLSLARKIISDFSINSIKKLTI